MSLTVYQKSAGATRSFAVDWSTFVTNEGVVTPSIQWTVPSDLTNVLAQFQSNIAVIYLSGGVRRKFYTITSKLTDDAGVIVDEQQFVVQIV